MLACPHRVITTNRHHHKIFLSLFHYLTRL